MNLSFKKRIATYFMMATAFITLLVFGTIYFIVYQTVYRNLDNDLTFEAYKHKTELDIKGKEIHFYNKKEWEENEHKNVEVNPVFLQIVDIDGRLKDKSPNMKEKQMAFRQQSGKEKRFNTVLNGRAIRQVQIPLIKNNKTRGYIIAAMSLEATITVLENLRNTLLVLFPIVLLVLFFVTSLLAGRSILPVVSITKTTNRISRSNLHERVDLPPRKDELYDLSSSINELLNRIESALKREKQFTSDASHELRTPLSALRGTLEVLIRKPREENEYKEKIEYSLQEIDRMANIIDQLLEIARQESPVGTAKINLVAIDHLVRQILERNLAKIQAKALTLTFNPSTDFTCNEIDTFYGTLLIENLLTNAIKYSYDLGEIQLLLSEDSATFTLQIIDQGIGIKKEDLASVFQPFFRSEALSHKQIKGNGLGLSIVEKAAKALDAQLTIISEPKIGTEIRVQFKKILRQI